MLTKHQSARMQEIGKEKKKLQREVEVIEEQREEKGGFCKRNSHKKEAQLLEKLKVIHIFITNEFENFKFSKVFFFE